MKTSIMFLMRLQCAQWVTRTSDLPPLPAPCCLLLVSLGFLKAVPTAKSHSPPRVLVLAPLPPGTRASYWGALLSLIFWNHPATSDTNIQLWGSRGSQKPKVLSPSSLSRAFPTLTLVTLGPPSSQSSVGLSSDMPFTLEFQKLPSHAPAFLWQRKFLHLLLLLSTMESSPPILLSLDAGSCGQSSEHRFLGVSGGSQVCIVQVELIMGLEVKLLCVHRKLMVHTFLVIMVRHQKGPLNKCSRYTVQVFRLRSRCCDENPWPEQLRGLF